MKDVRFHPSHQNAERVLAELSELFDEVAPDDRVSAEEELREAGLDPADVGRRIGELTGGSEGVRGSRAGGRRRSPARRRESVSRSPRKIGSGRRKVALVTAGLLIAFGLGGLTTYLVLPPETAIYQGFPFGPRFPFAGRRAPRGERVLGDRSASLSTSEGARDGIRQPGVAVEQPVEQADRRLDPEHDAGAQSSGTGTPPGGAEDSPESALGASGDSSLDKQLALLRGEDLELDEPWILDASNWTRARGLVPDSVIERVKSGDYWFEVVALAPIVFSELYPERFWEASSENSGKYEVDQATCALIAENVDPAERFGYPFPDLQPTDPRAACKVMWNVQATGAMGGGEILPMGLDWLFASGLERSFLLSVDRLYYRGRSEGPLENPQHLRWASLEELGRPDGHRAMRLTRRSDEPGTVDGVWGYIAKIRRIRAINPANRSDGLWGSEISDDDYGCFDGKIEDFEWRLRGHGEVLAPFTITQALPFASETGSTFTVHAPEVTAAYEREQAPGAPWLPVENLALVRRPVWIVEARPKNRYYLYGSMLLYVDQLLFRSYWSVLFDWKGEAVKTLLCAHNFAKEEGGDFGSVTPGLTIAVNEKAHAATVTGRQTTYVVDTGQRKHGFEPQGLPRMD